MSALKATVVVPTTASRGPLLAYSIGSIQNQTIKDIEIFVIGDGVSEETRDMIHSLQKEDSRIRFFDHPKHDRRGEVYRHAALQEAKGEIVCYMCDRDLILPNHIKVMSSLLQDYNFVSMSYISVEQKGNLKINPSAEYFGPASKNDKQIVETGKIPLSAAGHTLDLYHKLPFGWRTTPKDEFTDRYMWKQFLTYSDCEAYSSSEITFLYFKRGHFPGTPVHKRERELDEWSKKIKDLTNIEHIQDEAWKSLVLERTKLRNKLKSMVLIHGLSPKELFLKGLERI